MKPSKVINTWMEFDSGMNPIMTVQTESGDLYTQTWDWVGSTYRWQLVEDANKVIVLKYLNNLQTP